MGGVIRGGDVVAFQEGEHRLLRRGEVAWEGDRVTYVGPARATPVEHLVDASGCLVIPGLITTHMHNGTLAGERLYADRGRKDYFQTGYLNVWAVPRGKPGPGAIEDPRASGRFAFAELLRGGVTTIVEGGTSSIGLAEVAVETGARAYLGVGFSAARHVLEADGAHTYDWDEDGGRSALDRALRSLDEINALKQSRVTPYLCPLQVDTCGPELLAEAAAIARDRRLLLQVHAGQNLHEFHEVLRRRGKTPIEVLSDSGVLGRHTIVAHCVLTTAHPFAHMPEGDDLEIIASAGATVAHIPLVFARRGIAMHSFSAYVERGINVTLGTDTYPRDLIAEMRLAGLISKIVDESYRSGTAIELFNAATLSAARALDRPDLGRLAPFAKADIVVVDLQSLRVGPYRDPLQALINCGVGDDVRDVVVDGELVLSDRAFTKIDLQGVRADAQSVADGMWRELPAWHLGASVDEYAPMTLPPFLP